MDQEEYDDYLVDKAKELLDEQTSDVKEQDLEVETDEDKDIIDKAEEEGKSKIPATFDPREIEHLSRNRKNMSNQELKEFLEKESDLQKELNEIDEWKGFSRWEERFMIQNNLNREPDEIAEELGREEKEVRLKMRMLGLDVEFQ
ncbi:MAG: hypothetical protein ACI8Z7_000912 [Candidatus Nanohaloarchaea archaeon]|jgi:hypothetical protein